MTIFRRPRIFTHATLVASFLGLSGTLLGCGDGDVGDDAKVTTPTKIKPSDKDPGKAWMRLVHASPDAPAVDVYAKGGTTPLLKGIAYGSATDYVSFAPGAYALELRASPSTASDPVAYATDTIDMAAGEQVTAIAAGLIGSDADGDKFRVIPLAEGFSPSGSGNAIVRVVHAGADAPSVGLDLGNDDPASPEVTGLDRFTDTGAAGIPITAGRAAHIGIAAGGARVTAFTTPELPDGAELFVIATGLTQRLAREADGFALLAVGPEGAIGLVRQDPQVYALHASPDAPGVDAFAGDAEIVDGISFGELAGPVQVPPGDYTLDFFAHAEGSKRPAGAPAASAKTGSLEPGERYLAIATGFLGPKSGDAGFQLAAYAEGFELGDVDAARLRIVHSSPDAPAVDLGLLNAEKVVSPLVKNVSFGDASEPDGLSTDPATVPLGVAPAGNDSTVVASFHVKAIAGARAFAIAAGALDPTKGQSFRLLAVDTSTSPWTALTIQPQPPAP